jgi:hypothetical protein
MYFVPAAARCRCSRGGLLLLFLNAVVIHNHLHQGVFQSPSAEHAPGRVGAPCSASARSTRPRPTSLPQPGAPPLRRRRPARLGRARARRFGGTCSTCCTSPTSRGPTPSPACRDGPTAPRRLLAPVPVRDGVRLRAHRRPAPARLLDRAVLRGDAAALRGALAASCASTSSSTIAATSPPSGTTRATSSAAPSTGSCATTATTRSTTTARACTGRSCTTPRARGGAAHRSRAR